MTTFIISISFLLHVIAFLLIYFLAKHVRFMKRNEVDDIQSMFEHYLNEIKQENIRLQADIRSENQSVHRNYNYKQLDIQQTNDEKNDQHMKSEQPLSQTIETIDDTYEMSLQAHILQLYDQGYQVDEIAKQLNCGKTEVELTVKVHKNI